MTSSSRNLIFSGLLFTLYVAAAICIFLGIPTAALILVVIGAVTLLGATVVGMTRTVADRNLPEISAETATDLRRERDQVGEVSAVNQLRKRYPQLSLLEATKLVRNL